MKKIPALFIILGCLMSCTIVPKGEVFKSIVETDSPLLYLYRTKRVQIGGGSPLIRLDTVPVGKVSNGGYIAIKLKLGENTISLDKNVMDWNVACPSLTINAQSNDIYFAKIVVGKEAVELLSAGNSASAYITWNCAVPLIEKNVAVTELNGLVANTKNAYGVVN